MNNIILIATSIPTFTQVPPVKDNGADIFEYRVRGKSAGGDMVQLYRGPGLSFLATDLHPEFAYSFEVCAVNSAGAGEYSHACSIQTPKRADKPRPRDPESFEWLMALQFRDAWKELWDPQAEQAFYFNRITGTRQLEVPECFNADVEGEVDVKGREENGHAESFADTERREEVEFRKKRYRLLRSIHQSKNKSKSGRAIGSSMSSSEKVKSVELRRDFLLIDAFRRISTATQAELGLRLKFQFKGEAGIDSGGVGKEAFLLLSRAAAGECTHP